MPRVHVDYKRAKELLIAHLAQVDQQYLTFDTNYQHFEDQPALRVACRLVRILASDIARFDRNLREVVGNLKYTATIIPGPTADTVRVFTNLMLDSDGAFNEEDLQWCSPYTYGPELLKTFATGVMTDLADAKKCLAWKGTNRCLKRLKRSEVMSVARALTRYTNMVALGYRDNEIRDKADTIVDNFKPMGLIEATEPADFLEMYSTGPESCMTPYESRSWYFLVKEDTHPCAFFAHHPYTKGIYTKKRTAGGEHDVAARCIVYQQADGKWYYGRIYTNGSTSIRAKFIENLRAQGYEELTQSFDRAATFTIPGTRIDSDAFDEADSDDYDEDELNAQIGDYACPMPYFDNLTASLKVTWDKGTKLFTVTAGSRGGNVDLSSTAGYTSAGKLTVTECAHCDARIRYGSTQYNHQSNGNVYCSPECVRGAGHVVMIRSDGREVVRDIDESTVQDVLTPSRYWTNMAAAERRGATPASRSLFIGDEEGGVSTDGQRVTTLDGGLVRASYDSFNRAHRSGMYDTTITFRLAVRQDQLADVSMTFSTVTAMTADFNKPALLVEGKMVVPANFRVKLEVRDRFAISSDIADVKLTSPHWHPSFTPMFEQIVTGLANAA
jgi:hypothetical protein